MNNQGIKTAFPREAAALAMESKVLRHKTKGDHITAREILDATGMEIRSMQRRIKTWAKKNHFVLRAVPGDGYRVLTDAEHADYGASKTKSALRVEREGLRSLVVTDQTKLDDAQIRRHEFLMPRAAARVARIEQDVKDTNKEFKLTERVPLRALKGGSEG